MRTALGSEDERYDCPKGMTRQNNILGVVTGVECSCLHYPIIEGRSIPVDRTKYCVVSLLLDAPQDRATFFFRTLVSREEQYSLHEFYKSTYGSYCQDILQR